MTSKLIIKVEPHFRHPDIFTTYFVHADTGAATGFDGAWSRTEAGAVRNLKRNALRFFTYAPQTASGITAADVRSAEISK